jgi:integrase/recombinase XerD
MTSLRQRMIEDMQVRNLAVGTQQVYVQQVSLFARYFNKSPELLGPEQIRTYQIFLTNEKKLGTNTIILAMAALRFLYKVTLKRSWSLDEVIPTPRKPQKLPVILSPEEVLQFLDCVRSRKHRVILTTCYAAGLRISEAIALTLPAIDSKRMVIRVEQGKGKKDRYTMLSPKLLGILRVWWRVERPKDWLFPSDLPGRHITRFAVESECRIAHRISKIPKPITPHSLSYVLSFNYVLSLVLSVGFLDLLHVDFRSVSIAFPFYFFGSTFALPLFASPPKVRLEGKVCSRGEGVLSVVVGFILIRGLSGGKRPVVSRTVATSRSRNPISNGEPTTRITFAVPIPRFKRKSTERALTTSAATASSIPTTCGAMRLSSANVASN